MDGLRNSVRMDHSRSSRQMSRACGSRIAAQPDDLYDYLLPRPRRAGRPVKHDPSAWIVTDDWPERVPVTEREVDVFEAWFGDILDELLGPF
jgi:hypothetical protein